MTEPSAPDVADQVYGPSSSMYKVLPLPYDDMDQGNVASTGDHLEFAKPQPVPPPSGRVKRLLPGSLGHPGGHDDDQH